MNKLEGHLQAAVLNCVQTEQRAFSHQAIIAAGH